MTEPSETDAERFDYVIVGAGSAGCVLAARLSEDRSQQVLLLEAGPRDRNPAVHVPAAFPKLYDTRLDWAYRTLPQPGLAGRRVFWPRGRVLGGSSSINAMMWVRGMRADFDEWGEAAGPDWSYDALLPCFRRAEDTEGAAPESTEFGVGGALPVTYQRDVNPLTRSWIAAAREIGIGELGTEEPGTGVAPVMVNQRNGRRVSAADAYLAPALGRPNLRVRTGCLVERVIVKEGRAAGVTYRRGRERRTALVRRDVVLAAGAVNSPQLLQLSGIGAGAHLRQLGIEVVLDLPQVGRNLQDHLTSGVALAATRKVTLAGAQSPRAILDYLVRRRGLLTSNIAEGYGFVRSRPELELPDLELLFVPGLFINEGLEIPRRHGLTLGAVLLKPKSRGRVEITTADPSVAPDIDPAYLSDPEGADALTLAAGIRTCIELARTPTLQREIAGLVQPPGELGEETVETALRQYAQTLYHPVGTCRMGRDADSVVDERLAVRGIEGLRVIDASVMPTIPRGHTHASTVVIAEHGAEFLARSAFR